MTKVTFKENFADDEGGALYMSTYSHLNVGFSTFKQNVAKKASAIMLIDMNLEDYEIANCKF